MCSSLFVVACVQTLFFFFLIYCISRSHTRILLTTFFLRALHYFSLNIIYKFAFNTHTLLQPERWHTYTRTKSKAHSPHSLRLPNSTQKLRSCYAISARFKVHTHMVDVVVVVVTVLSRFHSDCTTIQAIIG